MFVSHAMMLKIEISHTREFENIDISVPCMLQPRYIALKPVCLHSISVVCGIARKKERALTWLDSLR
jgi:hypothetical protein